MTEPPRIRSLWDMLRLDASALLQALNILETCIGISKQEPEWLAQPGNLQFAQSQLDTFVAQLRVLYVPTTLKGAERLAFALRHERVANPVFAGYLDRQLQEVRSRLQDELSGRFLLSLNARQAALLEEASDFGGEIVQEKFPEVAFDLEEGAKCFALGQYTACVFHLMRAMESLALVMAAKVGAPTQEGNGKTMAFGKLVNSMNDKIKARAEFGEQREEWSAAYTLLLHVNRGYRVPVAHPGAKYTEEEAERIMMAVRGFIPALGVLV